VIATTPSQPGWVFWLVLALAWFATMGWRPMLEPDEGRYAEIPREMHVTGDWVTPRLDGLKYFEKPPLQYWATATMYTLFGVGEWTARFWSCALAFLCLPLTYAFARHLYGGTAAGLAALAALAINPYFAIVGQLNLLDSSLTFFLTAAMFTFLRARAAPAGSSEERRWMLLVALALAFATLTKGIVALVLAGGTLLLHMIVTREVRPLRRWHLPLTIPLYFAVTAPWFFLVSARNPEFPGFFFVHEHFQRFLTDVSDRVEPWWFFLPSILLAVLPWIALIAPVVRDLWRRGPRDREASTPWFILIWCVFTVFFFSISHSKLPTYVLPIMPALAVLLAPRIADARTRVRSAAWIAFGLIAFIGVGLVILGQRSREDVPYAVFAWSAIGGSLALLGVMFAKRRALVPIAASILAFQALIVSYSSLPPVRTAKWLVNDVRPAIGPQTRLFSVDQYRQSIPPYLGRTLRPVMYRGELEFGIAQDSGHFIETLDQFIAVWLRQSDAVAFVDAPLMKTLDARQVPMRVIARDDRTVAVARR
jgi:4-amino-4-deoxy-L-arabinose transferase-like glycosyltransferase